MPLCRGTDVPCCSKGQRGVTNFQAEDRVHINPDESTLKNAFDTTTGCTWDATLLEMVANPSDVFIVDSAKGDTVTLWLESSIGRRQFEFPASVVTVKPTIPNTLEAFMKNRGELDIFGRTQACAELDPCFDYADGQLSARVGNAGLQDSAPQKDSAPRNNVAGFNIAVGGVLGHLDKRKEDLTCIWHDLIDHKVADKAERAKHAIEKQGRKEMERNLAAFRCAIGTLCRAKPTIQLALDVDVNVSSMTAEEEATFKDAVRQKVVSCGGGTISTSDDLQKVDLSRKDAQRQRRSLRQRPSTAKTTATILFKDDIAASSVRKAAASVAAAIHDGGMSFSVDVSGVATPVSITHAGVCVGAVPRSKFDFSLETAKLFFDSKGYAELHKQRTVGKVRVCLQNTGFLSPAWISPAKMDELDTVAEDAELTVADVLFATSNEGRVNKDKAAAEVACVDTMSAVVAAEAVLAGFDTDADARDVAKTAAEKKVTALHNLDVLAASEDASDGTIGDSSAAGVAVNALEQQVKSASDALVAAESSLAALDADADPDAKATADAAVVAASVLSVERQAALLELKTDTSSVLADAAAKIDGTIITGRKEPLLMSAVLAGLEEDADDDLKSAGEAAARAILVSAQKHLSERLDMLSKYEIPKLKQTIIYTISRNRTPVSPQTFREEWCDCHKASSHFGVPDPFANSNQLMPYIDARALAQSLKLRGEQEWVERCKSKKRPTNMPANPQQAYAKWTSWDDWLGVSSGSDGEVGLRTSPYTCMFGSFEIVCGNFWIAPIIVRG